MPDAMSYEQCLDYLTQFNTRVTDRRNGAHLKTMRELLALFGLDTAGYQIIQITGSCGKGSTAHFLSSMLAAHGIHHGLFTGPHLDTYEERFAYNGETIPASLFISFIEEIKARLETEYDAEKSVGHMHVMVLIALMFFQKKGAGLLVFENGVGGESDPSNVFDPFISVITEITIDHSHLLGNTIREIVRNKAAIIKKSTAYAVCGMTEPQARIELQHAENERISTRFLYWNREYESTIREVTKAGSRFDYKGFSLSLDGVKINMPGRHQVQNASTALCVMEILRREGFGVEEEAVRKGLSSMRFSGRMEWREVGGRKILLDGAHNPLQLQALANYVKESGIERKRILVSFTSNRDMEETARLLAEMNAPFYAAPSPFKERRVGREDVERNFHKYGVGCTYCDTVEEAFRQAMSGLQEDEVLIVTGSLYLVGFLNSGRMEALYEI
ncbi:bifunctional folylpolyglutamate synthase/dihydrofolate synthase [Aneurinibacillus tyrosinisolvens]|uniref:bifunctional folylpolyglutamate synthase/dihydrofolate synthase n=1 Tax=Aneurinibacillus tyrosinisolvens TaxID=1443435 RepID=UPI00063FA9DA|nr:Mur ligase family protein [Aneurinibacillus tyrosinisolvens]